MEQSELSDIAARPELYAQIIYDMSRIVTAAANNGFQLDGLSRETIFSTLPDAALVKTWASRLVGPAYEGDPVSEDDDDVCADGTIIRAADRRRVAELLLEMTVRAGSRRATRKNPKSA